CLNFPTSRNISGGGPAWNVFDSSCKSGVLLPFASVGTTVEVTRCGTSATIGKVKAGGVSEAPGSGLVFGCRPTVAREVLKMRTTGSGSSTGDEVTADSECAMGFAVGCEGEAGRVSSAATSLGFGVLAACMVGREVCAFSVKLWPT